MAVGRCFCGLAFVIAATPCAAAEPAYPFHVPAGDLAAALDALAHQANIELLFAPALVDHRSAPKLDGTLSVRDGLGRLLAGTGLDVRRTSDGAFVIFAARSDGAAPTDVVTVPAILVVGRRTQDADIRRTENDIQPYQVIDPHEIETSHADTVDDLFRSRLSSNAEISSAMQDSGANRGSTRSEIDLHGFGASQTLVLVDGRRLPSLPTSGDNLLQPDLNGIPLSAIDRIETLTATAGGIYGPGATGGVVNIILKRDYRGAELNVTAGETSRGDARRAEIDGQIGFTPNDGRTDIGLTFSLSSSSPLRAASRGYENQALAIRGANNPIQFVGDDPLFGGIFVGSFVGPLSLKSPLGGAALGSTSTFLPLNYGGVFADGGALLRANAGALPPSLSVDSQGSPASLEANPSTASILVNVRHKFSDAIEGFVDVIDLRNEGRANESRAASPSLSASAPTSPFAQSTFLVFPLPGFDASMKTRIHMARVSGGLIAELPFGWRANADYSWGLASQDSQLHGSTIRTEFYDAVDTGLPGPNGLPALNPLGNWMTFVSALQAYRLPTEENTPLTNHLGDASLRLAGPVAHLSSGPVTLTLLAEDRREEVSASTASTTNLISDGLLLTETPRIRQQVSSLYGELRAPLMAADSPFLPLRGLEVQLAVRYDRNTTILPANFDAADVNSAFVTARQGAVVYTAGLKLQPWRSLLLRASVATGVLPPSIQQLGTAADSVGGTDAGDPKRGNLELGSEAPVEVLSGGSPALRPERARAISVGGVFQPGGATGPRISVDFTRIDKSQEISGAHGFDFAYFLANEADFPGRVVRAPLSAADAALGFTGGVVTQIDTTDMNIGATVAETVDLALDYAVDFPAGRLRLHGLGTWQPVFRRRDSPGAPWTSLVEDYDGPLEWRANGTVEWSTGRASIGAAFQYYGRYRVASSNQTQFDLNDTTFQGSAWIPAQAYIDLFASWRFDLPTDRFLPRTMELRAGIQDIFDKAPPIVAGYQSIQGYSTYGDPRGRRFEVSIASRF